jgi:pimeloyl-ACP methyl ester carboxylesterase
MRAVIRETEIDIRIGARGSSRPRASERNRLDAVDAPQALHHALADPHYVRWNVSHFTKLSGGQPEIHVSCIIGETNDISLYTMVLSFIRWIPSALLAATTLATSSAAAVSTSFLKIGSGSIAYNDSSGTGPLVICVPGMGDVRQQYRFLAPALHSAGYRVVTMDLRGMGESSVGWPDYSAAAIGSDIVALIAHLGAPHAFIIGNSMAAAAAVWAAAQIPDRISGVVLIGPFVRDVPQPWWTGPVLKVAMMRPWGVASWSMYYKSLYPTSPPADLDEYRRALRDNLKQPGRMEALRQMADASKASCEARIPEVIAPVLVLMGSKDPDFSDPAAEAKLVADRLHGRLAMIDGAGHYPHAEMPAKVELVIIKFLGGANGGVLGKQTASAQKPGA